MRISQATLLFLSLYIIATFIPAISMAGAVKFSNDQPIKLDADSIIYEKGRDTYHAKGDVVIRQGEITIKADSVRFDNANKTVTAEGNIVANDEGGNILNGDRIEFNLNTNTAVIANARIFFKEENVYIESDYIEKTGEETYKIGKSTFTTCDCEAGDEPAWSVYSKKSSVEVGQFLQAWHNSFNIKGVPVLYFPYLTAPIGRERQTGFLSPMFGVSEQRGVEMDNAFFWAISDNTDATFYLDVMTEKGVGEGIEYRYIRRRGSAGKVNFNYFKEKDIDRIREYRADSNNLSRPLSANEDRWRFKYTHLEEMPSGIVFKANIDIVSDDEYFIDFGNAKERSFESLESTISLSKGWERYNLVGEARYFDNLLVEGDKATLQMLPVVTFTAANKRIAESPLYLSLKSSLANFERQAGVSGQRLDLIPQLSLPLNPGGYFELTPSIAPRGTFYLSQGNNDNSFQYRGLYEANVDITTTFIKISQLKDNNQALKKLKHTIRPKLLYTYIPGLDQSSLPSYDTKDRIAKKNELSYSMISILTGKLKEDDRTYYRDYIYLDLRQSYSIHEATRELSSPTDKRRPFSDISGEIIITPKDGLRITGKMLYDPYDNSMGDYYASLISSDNRGDSIDLSYRYVKDSNEYLDFNTKIQLSRSLDFTYRNRYSFDNDQSIEASYGLAYQHQCWGILLSYKERIEEKVVMLSVNLLGIGEVGGFGTKFGK